MISRAKNVIERGRMYGQGLQYLHFLAQGFVKETEYDHEEDETPGWWCVDPNVPEAECESKKKFYLKT